MLGNAEIVLRLGLAALFGSAIGFERERLLWAAGLRTHMLVSVGACLMIIVSAFGFSEPLRMEHVVLDPSRIAAQVVSGIGFLGAGTILLRGEMIKGLTTAASLWTVAGIGLAVGAGMYVAGFAATVLVLVILAGIKPLEERFRAKSRLHTVQLVTEHRALTIEVLQQALGPYGARVKHYVVQESGERGSDQVTIALSRGAGRTAEQLAATLRALPGVTSAEILDAPPPQSAASPLE